LISLFETPTTDKSDEDNEESRPNERGSGAAALIAFLCLIPIGILYSTLGKYQGGVEFCTMLAYTYAIPYITSDRFLGSVPWKLLMRSKVLLGHCVALAFVWCVTAEALVIKPRLPSWFITEGRKGSFFEVCLGCILLSLAFYECSWISKQISKKESI
jgi:hypothetical protein